MIHNGRMYGMDVTEFVFESWPGIGRTIYSCIGLKLTEYGCLQGMDDRWRQRIDYCKLDRGMY